MAQDNAQPLLFVIDHFRNPHAGTEGQLFQLVKGLDRSRFSPHLLVFRDSDYLREQGFPCDYSVLGYNRILSLNTWVALWRFARQFRASGGRLAHIFFNDPSVLCPPIFRMNGIESIISRRDMGYWYTRKYLAMLSVTGRFVSAAITNSEAVRQVTVEKEPVSVSHTHVIYNGYDVDSDVGPVPEDLRILRANHPGAIFLGIVANIRPIKRIEDAIRAVGILSLEGVRVHLVVIGDGDPSALQELAREQGVSDQVHVLGTRRNVKACLAALDVGLLCSESEGFSNALVEYMQAGLPVVCSAVGGNPEAIRQDETGYLYPCGEVATLAKYIKRLAGDDELRGRLGENARTSARERFSMQAMVGQHQAVYQQLLCGE